MDKNLFISFFAVPKTPPLILKEGIALKVLESERLRTFKLVGIECFILVHSRKFFFLTFFAICS